MSSALTQPWTAEAFLDWASRIEKLREYQAVPSILRYVIVESAITGLHVLHRKAGDEAWLVKALTIDDVLDLPEVGIAIPVPEIYEDIVFDAAF